MKKHLLSALAFSSIFILTASNAMAAQSDTGFYGAFGVNYTHMTPNEADIVIPPSGTPSNKTWDLGYRLQAGYQFNQYVALEGQYAYYGKQPTTYSVDGRLNLNRESALSLSVRGFMPVTSHIKLTGKVGYAIVTNTLDETVPAGDPSGDPSTSNTDRLGTMIYGVGAEYAITNNWSMRGEVEHLNAKAGQHTTRESITSYAVSAVYHF